MAIMRTKLSRAFRSNGGVVVWAGSTSLCCAPTVRLPLASSCSSSLAMLSTTSLNDLLREAPYEVQDYGQDDDHEDELHQGIQVDCRDAHTTHFFSDMFINIR